VNAIVGLLATVGLTALIVLIVHESARAHTRAVPPVSRDAIRKAVEREQDQ
jgi:hypothetical protein